MIRGDARGESASRRPIRAGGASGASRGTPGPVPARLGWLQQIGKRFTWRAFRWFCRLRVDGVEHVPRSGPVILASNHRSMLDVPLVVVACPRPVSFMAHQGLFADPVRASFFYAMGGYPVDPERGRDAGALGFGLAVLRRGEVLGLFPEGTRSYREPMKPFLAGAAWLSLRSGVCIVPCGIVGTETPAGRGWSRWLRRRWVRVAFGEPILPVTGPEPADEVVVRRARIQELTDRVRGSVAALTGDPG